MRHTVILILLSLIAPAPAANLFQVGNSFTNDSRPEGTELLLEQALGRSVDVGFHARGNQTLDSLWSNPFAADTLVTEFGDHTVALPNNRWDFLALQTFPALTFPTLGQELARVQDFVTAADQGSGGQTEIVIYGPWAGRRESDWNAWLQPVAGGLDTPTRTRAAYHDLLFDRVEEIYPGRVRLASAGKVIREVRDQILAGESSIESTHALYRDPIHLSELGQFIASTTVATTVSRVNPIGAPVPRDIWGESVVSDELALELQQIVWDVVTDDRRSGVSPIGDFNVDTVVDEADLALWFSQEGFRTAVTADPNGDGAVDAADQSLLQQVLNPGAEDINGDGLVNEADRELWVGAFGETGPNAADVNSDGLVDAADYTAWRDAVALADRVDFNRDGLVDGADSAILDSQFGWALELAADANDDGVVDTADFVIWQDAFRAAGGSTASVAIPEPAASTALALLTGAGLLVRRRVA